ncbi:DUF979 domain-containing protein [Gryllotalpicola ginsengisoli]|uniref:DUF979 domain-containing protein n=1 Tax=Gryllotalpicola ginsengisoli TaxID=444608 RepID=UPI0003B3A3B8|nr:DUF979 domain-containing protein [Gryllotalpicola ginsengisoli]
MITAEWLYWLIGAFFVAVSVLILGDRTHARRLGNGAFWGVLGLSFFYGTFVVSGQAPAWILGIAVLLMVVLAGFGFTGKAVERTTSAEEREVSAARFGNRLFIPALVIPAVTVLVALVGPMVKIGGSPLLADGTATLTGLGVSAIVATAVGVLILKPPSLATPVREGGRLLEAIGWAALLPQMLSTLGSLFTEAGVGTAVGDITKKMLPDGSLIAAVLVYCVGMAVFTVIMGNAFAAFPIMTAAVGWPVLVHVFHGNPAAVFSIGMLAGFCGTLTTPMAANFNLVPAALLEMRNRYSAIKAQLPTAAIMLVVNIGLMYFVAF